MHALDDQGDPVERFLIAAERYVSRAGDSGLSYQEVVSALDAARTATLDGGD